MDHHIILVLKVGQSKTDRDKSFKTAQLVWDSRASFRLTTFCADFIDYVEYDIDVKDISKLNKVVGFGTTLHTFLGTNDDLLYIPALFYHLPSAAIWLFGPQAYHLLIVA